MKVPRKLSYLLIAGSILGTAGTTMATISMNNNQPQVVRAASDSNVIPDTTTDRTLTIHKYTSKDTPAANAANTNNDGTEQTIGADHNPMSGVHFTIQKIATKLDDNGQLVSAKTGKAITDKSTSDDYDIDTTWTANGAAVGNDGKLDVVTGTDGSITTDLGTQNGIYLVTENAAESTDATDTVTHAKYLPDQAVKPFFVYVPMTNRSSQDSLNYAVHAYPKNTSSNLNPTKNIMTYDGKFGSVAAGQAFNWEAYMNIPSNTLYYKATSITTRDTYDSDGNKTGSVDIPVDQMVHANYYKITDVLDSNLTLDASKTTANVVYKTAAGDQTLALEKDVDYTLTYDTASNKVVIALTDGSVDPANDGMKKIAEAMTANGGSDWKMHVIYNTTAKAGFSGDISNNITGDYLTPNVPGKHEHITTPPIYATGGFDLEKTNEDGTKMLPGAEFMIATTRDNARNKKYLAKNGKSYTQSELDAYNATASTADQTSFFTATTDSNGKADFAGIPFGADASGKLPDDTNLGSLKRSIFVVETKAPDGYELMQESAKVRITPSTLNGASHIKLDSNGNAIVDADGNTTQEANPSGDGSIELTVKDRPKTDLPFTGGQGMYTLIVVAAALGIAGTAGIYMTKKKHQDDAEA